MELAAVIAVQWAGIAFYHQIKEAAAFHRLRASGIAFPALADWQSEDSSGKDIPFSQWLLFRQRTKSQPLSAPLVLHFSLRSALSLPCSLSGQP